MLGTACSADSTVLFDPDPELTGKNETRGGSHGSSSGAGPIDPGGSGSLAGTGSTEGGRAGTGGGQASLAGGTAGGASDGGGGGVTSAGNAGTTHGGAASGGRGGTSGAPSGGGGVMSGSGGMADVGGSGGTGGDDGGVCTLGLFEGHSYAFCSVVDSAAAATTKCKSLGMSLVSIESRAENTYIYGKQQSTWLGGTDKSVEGQWEWEATGTLFTVGKRPVDGQYTDWISGQPNDADKDNLPEDCLVLTATGWNDVACDLDDFKATCESRGPVVGPLPW